MSLNIFSLHPINAFQGLIPGLRPANGRQRYFLTTSHIGWGQTWRLSLAGHEPRISLDSGSKVEIVKEN